MVVNALSHKFLGSLAHIVEIKRPLINEIHELKANGLKFEVKEPNVFLAHVELCLSFLEHFKVKQIKNPQFHKMMEEVKMGKLVTSRLMSMAFFGIKIIYVC